ncbi:MAG: hypothetical protein U0L20_06510 [Ruminococcus sp.]|nr:hypothetical protein [Ruminococcus sp.]
MKPDEIKANLKAIGGCVNFEALEYISELESDLQLLKNDYQHSKSVAEETVERNKRLREKLMKALSDLKTAKNKAIREFSEKLRTRMQDLARLDNNGLPLFLVSEKFIDEIVEEMVGEIK